MQAVSTYKNINRGINQYTNNTIMNATPEELILRIYDFLIVQLRKEDASKSNRAINELIASLNFEYQEASEGLFRLYQYCLDCTYAGKYGEALEIIEGLRESWSSAFGLK